jgi:hypothetical protein
MNETTPAANDSVASRVSSDGERHTGRKGYLSPRIVRACSFYVISLCVAASVVVCILAIWDFAKRDALWRLIASFLVVAAGTALFAFINGIFDEEET